MEQLSTEDYNKLREISILNLRYLGKVYKIRITEDIIVDCTYHLYTKQKLFDSTKSSFSSYSRMVIRGFLIDYIRKNCKRKYVGLRENMKIISYINNPDMVDDILKPLSPINQQIIKRRIINGDSFIDIANEFGYHPSQIKTKYLRSLKVLREYESNT